MKLKHIAVGSALIAGAQSVKADRTFAVKDLNLNGFLSQVVSEQFSSTYGLNLNPSEFLKVSAEDEGSNIRFETMDHLSVTIDAKSALGIGNKDLQR